MKKIKRLLTILLAFVMLISTTTTTFAKSTASADYTNTTYKVNRKIIVTKTGVHINGVYYTQAQFVQLLNKAQGIKKSQILYSAGLVAGTWWIPGIGEVIITFAGVVIVAGVVINVGSWLYNVIKKWFEDKAFNESAENAVNSCNGNKQNHIMKPKHNWNKFKRNPQWSDVAPILIKVLKDGYEKWEAGDQYIRTLVYEGQTVVVRFIKDVDGMIRYISTAWCE